MITLDHADADLAGVLFTTPKGPVEIQVVLGGDGIPVIYIDTPEMEDGPKGPPLRIWLNDETVWEGVPVPANV